MDEYDDTWSWPVASLVDGWPDASVGVPQIGDAVPASAAAQSACFPGFEDLESQNPWSGNLATETADLHKTESRPLAISNTPWQAPNRDMGISADYTVRYNESWVDAEHPINDMSTTTDDRPKLNHRVRGCLESYRATAKDRTSSQIVAALRRASRPDHRR